MSHPQFSMGGMFETSRNYSIDTKNKEYIGRSLAIGNTVQ